jgi:hypothetical protein
MGVGMPAFFPTWAACLSNNGLTRSWTKKGHKSTHQPWGLRTAYFADPEGNLWEINQPIGSKSEG